MKRVTETPRPEWERKVEEAGLTFHSRDAPYWNEEASYRFTGAEIDTLEKAANDIHELYLTAAQRVIDRDEFHKLGMTERMAALAKKSWNADEQHLYGRFDFHFDGRDAPKLLEYNADTPSSLLEASVIQWLWLQEKYPGHDQWNSIHEHLTARWHQLGITTPLHVSAMGGLEEDVLTASYLQDTAAQAGISTRWIDLERIGYRPDKGFVGDGDEPVDALVKLYPWEWLSHEAFGQYLQTSHTRFIEPAWKMLWSNKGMLPILWEMAPNHPNLLPASFDELDMDASYVRKPKLSREGANVEIVLFGQKLAERGGDYGEEGYVYQTFKPTTPFDGKYPVLGVWMVGDEAAGMGIRESDGLITDNRSRFTPHAIDPR
jgi:glutathionylspermidine synthase